MFDFFRSSRTSSARDPSHLADTQPSGSISDSSRSTRTANHRDLIRVVLRDTLRMNGIPTEWIGCEVSPRSPSSQSPAYQIVLIVHRWHEGLLRYAPALQKQFLQSLQHFDPATDHTAHMVSWEFGPNCICPYLNMPAPAYWKMAPEHAKFDLAPNAGDYRRDYDDYVPTVPSALS